MLGSLIKEIIRLDNGSHFPEIQWPASIINKYVHINSIV